LTEGDENHTEWLVATSLHSTIPKRERLLRLIYLQRNGLPSRKKVVVLLSRQSVHKYSILKMGYNLPGSI